MTIEELIESASHDMFNPKLNFEIAKKYEELEQTASAVSFYLRAAEYGYNSDPLIVYTSLLKMSFCFNDQNGREHTVKNCLLQAIEYLPNRPEAYFLMSRYYERNQKWQECYTFAGIGLSHNSRIEKLPADVEYEGAYCLEFERGVSGWWLGKKKESKEIFERLLTQDISAIYRSSIEYNLERL
jgi:tetratricopeptide (TPR) repeat protein